MFRRKKRNPLDAPLLRLTKTDHLRVSHLLANAVAFGITGSGKTTGFGHAVEWAVIEAGWGGMIRCAKPEDGEVAYNMMRACGREKDAIVIQPSQPHRFNYLDAFGPDTWDIVKAINVPSERLRGGEKSSGEDGAFWEEGKERVQYRAVHTLALAGETVSGPNLQKFIMTAAESHTQKADPTWEGQFHNQVLKRAFLNRKTPMDFHEYEQDTDFWLGEWPGMADKTRSSLLAHVMNPLQVLNSGLVREILSTTSNCRPEDMFDGKFFILDLPYGQAGNLIKAAFIYAAQRAILKRQASPGDVPVVLYMDEYQDACNSFDPLFLAQCRSHLGCMVCLTQSVSGLMAQFHGHKGEHQARSLLSNFGTQVFCQSDPVTAEHASKMLGQRIRNMASVSMPPRESLLDELMGNTKVSVSFTQHYQPVQPLVFQAGLRTGGERNGKIVDAIVIRNSEPFSNGRNWLRVAFRQ